MLCRQTTYSIGTINNPPSGERIWTVQPPRRHHCCLYWYLWPDRDRPAIPRQSDSTGAPLWLDCYEAGLAACSNHRSTNKPLTTLNAKPDQSRGWFVRFCRDNIAWDYFFLSLSLSCALQPSLLLYFHLCVCYSEFTSLRGGECLSTHADTHTHSHPYIVA